MATTDSPATPQPSPAEAEVLARLEAGDSFSACLFIEDQGSSPEVCRLFHASALAAYNQRKSVREAVALFRAGIHFALREASRRDAAAPELAADLRGRAKAMAYDLGANTWPGWEDGGITLSAADLETGLEAARLNLKLAEELGRPDIPKMHAHWLLGAHLLAQHQTDAAIESFQRAMAFGHAGASIDGPLMAAGYVAIARLTANSDDADAREAFATAVSRLRELQTPDAAFYADQLESVRRFFER